MNENVLLINDMTGYGKVSLSVMIPVLSQMQVQVHNLPTALVSNTLDYGKFNMLDTTDFMQNTLKVWDEMGFEFDAIATGLILNKKQVEIIHEYCSKQSAKNVLILCDPIMADEGQLYPGIEQSTIECMKQLISCADYIVPNYTEACFLTNEAYTENPSKERVIGIINKLRNTGAKSVIITSVTQEDVHSVWGYDHIMDCYFSLPYKKIPVRMPGTGDIFSAILLGKLLQSCSLKKSVQEAMGIVYELIEKNQYNKDLLKGIEIECS